MNQLTAELGIQSANDTAALGEGRRTRIKRKKPAPTDRGRPAEQKWIDKNIGMIFASADSISKTIGKLKNGAKNHSMENLAKQRFACKKQPTNASRQRRAERRTRKEHRALTTQKLHDIKIASTMN